MSGEKKDNQKIFPSWLNDIVSFIAALFGLFVTWQTIQINQEIDRLKENVETSKFIGELIGSLTSEDTKQDIALLALDNALASETDETDEKRLSRNKRLVAKIASSVLNNPNKTPKPGVSVAARSEEIAKQGKTAEEILRQMAGFEPDEKLDCQKLQGLSTFSNQSNKNNSSKISNGSEKLNAYQKVALTGLTKHYCFENQTIPPPNEAITPTQSKTINEEIQKIKDNKNSGGIIELTLKDDNKGETTEQKQRTLNVATSATAISSVAEQKENIDGIVYLLYDDPKLKSDMEKLKEDLKKSKWFVPGEPFFISPSATNCATASSIRFFDQEDNEVAHRLRNSLEKKSSKSLKSYVKNIKLINLSNWSRAKLVPEKQLELWVISQGRKCKN